jgi:hypothetical protein
LLAEADYKTVTGPQSANSVSRDVSGDRLARSNFPDIKHLVRFAGEKGIHDSYVIIEGSASHSRVLNLDT